MSTTHASTTQPQAAETPPHPEPACTPPAQAKRVWVGFADESFELEEFERAAVRSQAIVKLVRSSACELEAAADPDQRLRAALTHGQLELHSVVFTQADLSTAEARLRPKPEASGAASFRLELEHVTGADETRFRIVRAVPE